jgi:RNA polymerase sigma-70 factor (ECF subfamily)
LTDNLTSLDTDAFCSLVQQKARYFYAIAYRVVLQRQTAEDVVQAAFAKLWENRAKIKGAPEPWLYRVVINLAIDDKRRLKFAPLPEDVAANNEPEKLDISQHLHALAPRQRAAIMMVYYDEIPQKQAAENLGLSVKALESLLSRAKVTLKEQLK